MCHLEIPDDNLGKDVAISGIHRALLTPSPRHLDEESALTCAVYRIQPQKLRGGSFIPPLTNYLRFTRSGPCPPPQCTVKCVDACWPFRVALIVVVPDAIPVASPATGPVLPTTATAPLLELHVTWLVRFRVEVSLNVPVAVNCCVAATPMVGFEGVMVREVSVAPVTVNDALPEIPP